ncbi:MAG TPA: Gfo/Idh/MocA family oxidoreductase [bacterium]|nr:Gfo/Idh/MocA family oxidoreductase [bacterium]HPN44617.1 Gfo/Idh/MocA family oxidoreductase [bacterium]
MNSTRRTFLKQSLVTTSGAGLAALLPGQLWAAEQQPAASDKLVVGLIGCKNMGWSNLDDFLKVPGVECAALSDIDDEWLNKRAADVQERTGKKPKLFKDFRKLLEQKDIDAVIVGTPDHWHCLNMVYACQAGKDVYVEKPLANSIAECDIMVRAARKYNRIVQVGQQQRSDNLWRDVINFVHSGKLGKIRRVKVWANFNYAAGQPIAPDEPVPQGVDFDMWLGPAPARSFNRNRFHGLWRMFWDYGGGLMTDWGVHLLDMALWAMNIQGAPKATIGMGGLFAGEGNAVETADTQNVLYQFDDFTLEWEHNAGIQTGPNGRIYGITFVGSNGTLWADRDTWEVIAEGWGENARMQTVPQQKSDGQGHLNHVRNFVECVKTRQTPVCDVQVGYDAAFYAHIGNIAYRTGETLVWDETKKQFSNSPAANKLLTPVYRAPWELPRL